ncbi:unnamed protein product, partial [Rotaria magnacalcarata]
RSRYSATSEYSSYSTKSRINSCNKGLRSRPVSTSYNRNFLTSTQFEDENDLGEEALFF